MNSRMNSYKIYVTTSNIRSAGTDANVYLQLIGRYDETDKIPLSKSLTNKNPFEQGKTDVFEIDAFDVGRLKKIRIGHDNKGFGAGWHLKEVVIESKNDGRKWFCECNNWFDKKEGDGKIERELLAIEQPRNEEFIRDSRDSRMIDPRDRDSSSRFIRDKNFGSMDRFEKPLGGGYKVFVTTSDKQGAGTDANVYIQMIGRRSETDKIVLTKSLTNSNKFERGRTDVFDLDIPDVGTLRKIKIGHDNKGIGPGWHLKEVVVESKTDGRRWLFECNRWLDKKEDDGKLERELLAIDQPRNDDLNFSSRQSLNKIRNGSYKIYVATSDKQGAGTDANVYIQLIGRRAETDKITLSKSLTNSNKFEKGKTDIFEIEAPDVGTLKRIRIGHDNKGIGPGWHLKEVVVDSKTEGRRWLCPCNRWLDKKEDDGKIERELIAEEQRVDLNAPPVEPEATYQVYVTTSDIKKAGTDANVYLQMIGRRFETPKITLANSTTNSNKFEKGKTDHFEVKSMDIGHLRKIIIGHDNKGIGPGWHLKEVVIETPNGQKIKFPCNRWLAKDEEDGLIERTLYPEDEELHIEKKKAKPGDILSYDVLVRTSDIQNAGTDANVWIKIYGELRKSEVIRLTNSKTHKNKFERGHQDEFSLKEEYFGDLVKIKIGHDNSGIAAAWHLESVIIESPETEEKWIFKCDKWLDKNMSEVTIDAEIAPKSSSRLRKKLYEVDVYTGNLAHAGTDANVYLTIYGDLRESTEQHLKRSETHRDKFERGNVDKFLIETPDLGKLIGIRVRHDNTGPSPSWYCERIEIYDRHIRFSFPIQKWFCLDREDRKIDRIIKEKSYNNHLRKKRKKQTITYAVEKYYYLKFFTGNKQPLDGTDVAVSCRIFGDFGESDFIKLNKNKTHSTSFNRDQIDLFVLKVPDDLGTIYAIELRFESPMVRPNDLHLFKVQIQDEKFTYEFPFNDMIPIRDSQGEEVRLILLERSAEF